MVILGIAAHQRNKIAVQEIICLDVAFYLLHRLGAEQRIERFIISYQFLERIYIIGLRIDKLADARRIIHRFVLERRQTVVEHGIGDMKLIVLIFSPMQLIGHQLQFQRFLLSLVGPLGLGLFYHGKPVAQYVAVIEQIISQRQLQQQQDEQHHGHGLRVLALLHRVHVIIERIIGTYLAEQLGINLVVALVERPLVQRQGSHGTLVSQVQDDVIIGWQSGAHPGEFCRHSHLRMSHHEILAVGILREIEGVEIMARRIGKGQGALVGAVDIAEVGAICKIVGTLEIGIYVRLVMIVALADVVGLLSLARLDRSRQQHEEHDEDAQQLMGSAGDAFRQTETEAAPLAQLAFCLNLAAGKERTHLLIFLYDTLAVEQSEAVTARIGPVEDMRQLLLVHTLSGI